MPTTFCKSSYFGHNMLKTPVLPGAKLGFLDGLRPLVLCETSGFSVPKRANILKGGFGNDNSNH